MSADATRNQDVGRILRTTDAYTGSAFTLQSIVQRIWDPLYIDALIAMQTDTLGAAKPPVAPPDGDFSNASILYSIADRKYDVIAMLDDAGNVMERTRYTAYGVARHEPFGDSNGDGAVDGTDQAAVLVNWDQTLGAAGSSYTPDLDFNRDGVIDGADLSTILINWKPAAEPEGHISTASNTIGY